MTNKSSYWEIFQINSDQEFNELSLQIFRDQYVNNLIYRRYIDFLGYPVNSVNHYSEIPFMPIEFFKSQRVMNSSSPDFEKLFTSSGSTGPDVSTHYVKDIEVYIESFMNGFKHFYGSPEHYIFIALLPAYLERDNSSLVFMADHLIKSSKHSKSGFYLDHSSEMISILSNTDRKVLLLGVTFALLDLAETIKPEISNAIVMETGGMKGRRKEMIREEVHENLCSTFKLNTIHSEYGMTELLSQAYSAGKGIFYCPPWMKVLTRDTNDPLSLLSPGRTGGINIIDLANWNSCSFIATQDLGRVSEDGSFEVMGRFDSSDIRGCNLLLSQ